MKLRCDRDLLSEALQVVQRGVSSRPGIPALAGVLMEAGSDGTLTLTTTDLEVSARLAIEVHVQEEGIALVPARLVGDTVKSLSDAPVEIEADQAQARIRCAAYEGALRLLPAEDFPALQPPVGTRVVAGAAVFAEAVGQVARAASRDEARPVLTGVLLEVSREGVTLVATDSYRLAVRELVATRRAKPGLSCRSEHSLRRGVRQPRWRRVTSRCSWTRARSRSRSDNSH